MECETENIVDYFTLFLFNYALIKRFATIEEKTCLSRNVTETAT